jgi:hypothetical protein
MNFNEEKKRGQKKTQCVSDQYICHISVRLCLTQNNVREAKVGAK